MGFFWSFVVVVIVVCVDVGCCDVAVCEVLCDFGCVILVVLVVGCVCVEMWVWFGVVDMVLLVQPVIGVCGDWGILCVCLFVCCCC